MRIYGLTGWSMDVPSIKLDGYDIEWLDYQHYPTMELWLEACGYLPPADGWVAWSLGAWVALQTIQHQKVKKPHSMTPWLVAWTPFLHFDHEALPSFLRRHQRSPQGAIEFFRQWVGLPVLEFNNCRWPYSAYWLNEIAKADGRQMEWFVDRILIIYGACDPVITPAMKSGMYDMFSHAHLYDVAGAGHALGHDAPAIVTEKMEAFIKQQEFLSHDYEG
jgi:pimeloyl-ACP methyl ester carboxylesterase